MNDYWITYTMGVVVGFSAGLPWGILFAVLKMRHTACKRENVGIPIKRRRNEK